MTNALATAVGISYIFLGGYLVAVHPIAGLDLIWQYVLGGAMMAYGAFRIWRKFKGGVN